MTRATKHFKPVHFERAFLSADSPHLSFAIPALPTVIPATVPGSLAPTFVMPDLVGRFLTLPSPTSFNSHFLRIGPIKRRVLPLLYAPEI
jgi:hypothetical protein